MQTSTDYAQTEREEGPDLATGATPFNYGTDAGKWACPTCTYENEDSLDCCDMCMFNRIAAQTATVAAITAATAAAAADDDAQEHAEAETPRNKHHDDQELARRMALGLRVQRPETLHTTGHPLFAAVDAAGTSAGAVEEGVLDAFENFDPGSGCNEWLAAGSRFIGKRILRKAVNEKGVAWEMTGRVVGWLPPESTETIDGNALYHCVHNDGDEEDLYEDEVLESIKLWEQRDQNLDGTIYRERSVAVSSKDAGLRNRMWKTFQMMNPNGEAHPCNTSLPKHIVAGTPIRVQDLNPKAKASMSYARFDKYKSATTFKEMLDLGARRDDLYHDYAKGFIKLQGYPDVVPLTAHGQIMSACTVNFLSQGDPHNVVGRRITRRGITEETAEVYAGVPWEIDAIITGWLPGSANDGMTLFRSLHDDGDEEDIDLEQARAGVQAYEDGAENRLARIEAASAAAVSAPLPTSSTFVAVPTTKASSARRWNKEEEVFLEITARQFNIGILALKDGVSLIEHLSLVLSREPLQLHRKVNGNNGYVSRLSVYDQSAKDKAIAELQAAQEAFQRTFVSIPTSLLDSGSAKSSSSSSSSPSLPSAAKRSHDDIKTNAGAMKKKTKASAFKGVYNSRKAPSSKPWSGSIKIDGKVFFLGNFSTEEEAARKYDEAAAPLGRSLNFPSILGASSMTPNKPVKSSQYTGVNRAKAAVTKPWVAKITIDGKLNYLGTFETEEEAAMKYDEFAGPTGRALNFPVMPVPEKNPLDGKKAKDSLDQTKKKHKTQPADALLMNSSEPATPTPAAAPALAAAAPPDPPPGLEIWQQLPPGEKVFKNPNELISSIEECISGAAQEDHGHFTERLSSIELSLGISSLPDDHLMIAKRARLAAILCDIEIYKDAMNI